MNIINETEETLDDIIKQEIGHTFKTVLELASGSGILADILAKKGYIVTASDISKDMKEVAKNNYDGEYLILNMIDYHLDRKFDLIICFVDSINYLYEEELYKISLLETNLKQNIT